MPSTLQPEPLLDRADRLAVVAHAQGPGGRGRCTQREGEQENRETPHRSCIRRREKSSCAGRCAGIPRSGGGGHGHGRTRRRAGGARRRAGACGLAAARVRQELPRHRPLHQRRAARPRQPGRGRRAQGRRGRRHRARPRPARPRSRSPSTRCCRALRQGTRATIRTASLSGVANRYVDLEMPPGEAQDRIPDGGVIDLDHTTTVVDLDHLFSLFDEKTKRGLRNVIAGFADSYAGQEDTANAGWAYLNPSLVGAQRLFEELSYDRASLQRFVVSNAKLANDAASRRGDLAKLVDRLATTLDAIGREQDSLRLAVSRLPPFMRRANTTFVNLRATLDDLDPLIDESRPVTPKLRAVLAQLAPFARDARPTVRDLSKLVRRPGGENDLLDLSRAILPFRDVALRRRTYNGELRDGSFVAGTESLRGQIPAVRLPAALRRRPHRLVRRLQPLRHLRRVRLGLARDHQRVARSRSSTASCSWCRRTCARRSSSRWRRSASATAARAPPSVPPTTARTPSSRPTTSTATRPRSRPGHEAHPVHRAAHRRRAGRRGRRARARATRAAASSPSSSTTPSGSSRAPTSRSRACAAGKIQSLDIDQKSYRALVGIEITATGYGDLRKDVFCESRPQSLIGEYFLDCLPGKADEKLERGRAHPRRAHGLDGPRRPGQQHHAPAHARAASRSCSASSAPRWPRAATTSTRRSAAPARRCARPTRCWPSWPRERRTIRDLIDTAEDVVTRLADNRKDVTRFVREARDTAAVSAERQAELRAQFQRFPTFLRELRPTHEAARRGRRPPAAGVRRALRAGRPADDLPRHARARSARRRGRPRARSPPPPAPAAPRSAPAARASASWRTSPRSCPSCRATWPSRSSTSTTATSPSRRTRGRRAARASPASRRCCSTSSASRRPPTSTTPTPTCSRSRRSSTTPAPSTRTPRPPGTRPSSTAARSSGRASRASTSPTRPPPAQARRAAPPTRRRHADARAGAGDPATALPDDRRRPTARWPAPSDAGRATRWRWPSSRPQPLLDFLLGLI